MCEESKNCLCHKIKDHIIKDKKEKFLSFFTARDMEELYLFLKSSYPLINSKTPDRDFTEGLPTLVHTFIKPNVGGSEGFVINVNQEKVKTQFLATYRKYQNQERSKTKMQSRLEQLVHDVEKLVYNNLEDNQEFITHLQQDTKKLRRSISLRLTKFLTHKKSPSNDGQAHENQAESSSSSSSSPIP